MVPSETTSTTACKWCMACISNSLNRQDEYRGETKSALVERNCVLIYHYLIKVFRKGSQARLELCSGIFWLFSAMQAVSHCQPVYESWIVYHELAQPVFWKLLEGFLGNTLGHFCIREPEILLKMDSTPVFPILGNI